MASFSSSAESEENRNWTLHKNQEKVEDYDQIDAAWEKFQDIVRIAPYAQIDVKKAERRANQKLVKRKDWNKYKQPVGEKN